MYLKKRRIAIVTATVYLLHMHQVITFHKPYRQASLAMSNNALLYL